MQPPEPGKDPAIWLATSREHLSVAANTTVPFRLRCFCSQRAVELALKGVLIHHGIAFPFTHTVEHLAKLLPGEPHSQLADIGSLTPFAVEEMYPDTFTGLTEEHAVEAVELARGVVEWAASIIGHAQ